MKVLELYSGIGGMHFALKGSTVAEKSEVILAVDLNPICNEIYQHNFPDTPLLNKNITALNAALINSLTPDIVLMSPPCQPFSRLGKQKDMNDTRNNSFLQFIKLLPELNSISFILIENVKGFETSETRECLVSVLKKCGFIFEEYLLNPRQLGICNSRLRYYLLAKRPFQMILDQSSEIKTTLPEDYENIIRRMQPTEFQLPKRISDVLEYQTFDSEWDEFSLGPEKLRKYFSIIDIVSHDSENSCCFTRGYSRCMERAGSVLSAISADASANSADASANSADANSDNKLNLDSTVAMRLRFFTPKEVVRLMTFPEKFSFPEHITLKQRYKTIGNSINVFMVSLLISYLIKKDF